MDRRTFLASLGAGVAATTGGCVADGRPVVEMREEVTIRPLNAWWKKLPKVGGNGALSFTIRADQRFDVYYFTERTAFSRYRLFVYNRTPSERSATRETATTTPTGTTTPTPEPTADGTALPTGHEDISQAAVPTQEEKYEVKVPDDGGRKSIETEGKHYLAVDHTNYGDGVTVERFQDPLTPFIDLEVIDEDSII